MGPALRLQWRLTPNLTPMTCDSGGRPWTPVWKYKPTSQPSIWIRADRPGSARQKLFIRGFRVQVSGRL
jgi:hypothetical protein